MNFLGIIYLSYAFDKSDGRDFKIVKSLFDTAIKHQDLITSPIHLGCIYNHLGQLYDCATRYMDKNPAAYFKGAIEYYRLAQKYLSKYTYPYDYGYISYKLSKLFFNYWRQKEDIQALRDAVFQLREAEKIYTYALFPEFWAEIQGQLGYLLSLLGSFTKAKTFPNWLSPATKTAKKSLPNAAIRCSGPNVRKTSATSTIALAKTRPTVPLLKKRLNIFTMPCTFLKTLSFPNESKNLPLTSPAPTRI